MNNLIGRFIRNLTMDGLYDDAGHGAGAGGAGGGGGAAASAYGSGGATGRFQVTDFLKKPQVIVRLFAFVRTTIPLLFGYWSRFHWLKCLPGAKPQDSICCKDSI